MGTQIRHFKALSKKNWINWKRTLAGSITEILCPILLMGVLAFLRFKIARETLDDFDLAKFRHGLYPMSKMDMNTNQYVTSLDSIAYSRGNLRKFMNRGGVSTDVDGTDYLPIFDQKGPLMFFPPHCVPLPEINIYGSPVIAYIKSKS